MSKRKQPKRRAVVRWRNAMVASDDPTIRAAGQRGLEEIGAPPPRAAKRHKIGRTTAKCPPSALVRDAPRTERLRPAIVSHLIGDKPGVGWLWSILEGATLALEHAESEEANDSFRRNSARFRYLRAKAQIVMNQIRLHEINDHHPLAQVIAEAMEVVHLGWQAEVAVYRHLSKSTEQLNSDENKNKRRKTAGAKSKETETKIAQICRRYEHERVVPSAWVKRIIDETRLKRSTVYARLPMWAKKTIAEERNKKKQKRVQSSGR